MKNVSELRIPAYAIVNTEVGIILNFASSRDEARFKLSTVKSQELQNTGKFKILKLKAEKFVR